MPTLDDLPIIPKLAAIQANDLIAVSETSTGCSRVRAVPAALIAQGFTHAWRIDYNNSGLLGETTDNTNVVVSLGLIAAGSMVERARMVVVTEFAGITALTAQLGRTGSDAGYLAAADIIGGARVFQDTGSLILADNDMDVVTGADQYLIVTFNPGSSDAVDELTAGSLYILVSMTKLADYAGIAEAV